MACIACEIFFFTNRTTTTSDWYRSTTKSPQKKQKKKFLKNLCQPKNSIHYSIYKTDQYSSCINSFTVNAQGTEKSGDGKISCTIRSPTGKKIHNSVENNNDGTYKVKYILPEEGKLFCLFVFVFGSC